MSLHLKLRLSFNTCVLLSYTRYPVILGGYRHIAIEFLFFQNVECRVEKCFPNSASYHKFISKRAQQYREGFLITPALKLGPSHCVGVLSKCCSLLRRC